VGVYGPHDAFNLSRNWFFSGLHGLDQAPIVVMVENYRSGLVWKLFMSNPEIQPMLDKIGFVPIKIPRTRKNHSQCHRPSPLASRSCNNLKRNQYIRAYQTGDNSRLSPRAIPADRRVTWR